MRINVNICGVCGALPDDDIHFKGPNAHQFVTPMTDEHKAKALRLRQLYHAQFIVDHCNCTWPLDRARNMSGHASTCPCHAWILNRMDMRIAEIATHSPNRARGMEQDRAKQRMKDDLGEPSVTDYCVVCGHSPDSAIHLHGPGYHVYIDPRMQGRLP